MNHADRRAIHLDQAWFCETCRVVSNDSTCSACASPEHTHRLAPWLDREPLVSVHTQGLFISIFADPAASQRRPELQGGPNV